MKHLYLFTIVLSLFTPFAVAQTEKPKPVTKDESATARLPTERLYWGYQTAVDGWVIRKGDTLTLGKGTLPTRDFAFIYQNPAAFNAVYTASGTVRRYLRSMDAGKRAIVKDIGQNGTKKTGFNMYILIGVGEMVRYYVELDNAVEAGEILPPPELRKFQSVSPQPVSVADELLKLKSLLDAGAITQQEYDQQKRKLLN